MRAEDRVQNLNEPLRQSFAGGAPVKVNRTQSFLGKFETFWDSMYGKATQVAVILAPVAFGYWAYSVEGDTDLGQPNFCTVSDNATTEQLEACSTIGRFSTSSLNCSGILTENGPTTNVAFQFNFCILLFMIGFLGFALALFFSYFDMDVTVIVGNIIAVAGLISLISVYMMHKYR